MGSKNVLRAGDSVELLSYIINVTPELRENIDLPVQGQSILPIGKIIMSNERYRNAFINAVNLIGLTVIKRNGWDNPWNFTTRGTLRFGQQIREIIADLANVYDYNANATDVDKFLDDLFAENAEIGWQCDEPTHQNQSGVSITVVKDAESSAEETYMRSLIEEIVEKE